MKGNILILEEIYRITKLARAPDRFFCKVNNSSISWVLCGKAFNSNKKNVCDFRQIYLSLKWANKRYCGIAFHGDM